jgi:DNA polymerase-3 subunit delta
MPIQGAKEIATQLAAIRKGGGKAIYLVHGSERYLVESSANAIARSLAEAAKAEIVRVDAAGLSPDRVLEPVTAMSLFASARVAIVRNFAHLLSGDAADRLLAGIDAGLAAGSALVFAATGEGAADKVDKRVRGYKGLAGRGAVLELNEQKPDDLLHWLGEKAAEEGKKLDADAARLLLDRAGHDMGGLRAELDKAVLYCMDRDRIRAKDLEQLVGKTRDDAVWDVTEAVSRGDAARARELVRDLEAGGTHPLVVLTFLVRQARHLLQARLLWEDAGKPPFRNFQSFQSRAIFESGTFGKGADDVTTMHPFAAFKRFEAASQHEVAQLRGVMARLRRAETELKTGDAEGPKEWMDALVLELAATAKRVA